MHGSSSNLSPRGTPSRRGKSPKFGADSPSQAGSSTVPSDFTNEPIATFMSSLDILVEGATSIESDSEKVYERAEPQHATSTEPRRAPRKSKTHALAALHHHAKSSSPPPGEEDSQGNLSSAYRIPVCPTLDLSSVKTPNAQRTSPQNKGPRPFGLKDCPEFYPTLEEFKDPMTYVRSISAQAKDYGICKVIPPPEWQMPFVTDTEAFRFRTRLQRLNSIEASSRAKVNFLEQLYRFHKQQGNVRVSVPTINQKSLDLWLLRKEVQKMGGYETVTREKRWSDLGRILGYRGIPGLSTQIKNSYTRVILPYEHFCERSRNIPGMVPAVRDPHLKTHTNIQSAGKIPRSGSGVTGVDDKSPPSSPLTATSSPLSEPPDDGEYKNGDGGRSAGSRARRNARTGSQDRQAASPKKAASDGGQIIQSQGIPPPVFYDRVEDAVKGTPEQHCEICHKKNRGEEMLLCDGCDCGFHMFCLDPPLEVIPKDQWFCYTCISGTGGDFGFDEGEEHSLSSFQARDTEFRRRWWQSHPPAPLNNYDADDPTLTLAGELTISESNVEEEFWRLVQSSHETVEVEYGADVHSTTHGSAMPTLETHPLDPYSKDPWNLNNIPILSDSLLRYIKSDISGMTVPWTYVGMAFSTFCWHNEDHYTYSINYMHWGETKTWYGIPGDDAENFEAAIKCEAPDLFEAQPDLLFQLVTLMNPKRLIDAGVRVYACNQRAGEFVITLPKAYHAGFNHGLNFNEAVNFALPDWLSYGRDCVERYREHRKLPVFSHDELLITITQQSQSIKTAMWLIPSLKEMVEREIRDRTKARDSGMPEILEQEDRPEDQYQCTICNTFCYLSFVMCQCTMNVACVDHAQLLCEDRPTHRLILRKRFSDQELLETRTKVGERASIPSMWRAKLNKLLEESPRPALRSLRALLAEGDRINYPLPELHTLRRCVNRANEWVDSANTFLIRKQSRKRSRRPRGRPSLSEPPVVVEDPGERPDRGLDDLYALLEEVNHLGFDCPEIGALTSLAKQTEETKKKASLLLNVSPSEDGRESFLQDCRRLLLDGSSINVLLDELLEIEKIVDQEQLAAELEEKLADEDALLTLDDVRQLLQRARTCNIVDDNKHVKLLEVRQKAGSDWEERATNLLNQAVKTIAELEAFACRDPGIPVDPALFDRLMTARAKAKDFDKQAKAWLSPDADTPKPRAQDVMRLISRAEKDFSITSVISLKNLANIAKDLETRCDEVLRNKYDREGEDVFETVAKWRNYALEHLGMFSLPTFEKLNTQIKLHEQWLEKLPWYCQEHRKPHGQDIFDDILQTTNPDDDIPPNDEYFTCICDNPVRPPPPGINSDAVQCDHCYARFHGECAKNGGSCPFCDHHHWNGTIHKERSWHFATLPSILLKAPDITRNYSEDWKQLEIMIHRLDRLSNAIGQFLAFTSHPANQRPSYIHQVRHYMRKLYKIQFPVSPNRDVSFGLDLASLHRILAGRPAPRSKKRRRPQLEFGQDRDTDALDGTRCVCRGITPYLIGLPTVRCKECEKLYHANCVFYPKEVQSPGGFTCPLCCLRKNKPYQYSDVRVRPSGAVGEVHESGTYVNTQAMLDTFSKDILYQKLPPPYTQTLFVELVGFVPGQTDTQGIAVTRPPSSSSHSPKSHPPMSHHDSYHGTPSVDVHMVPPPPWSRWGTVATPSRPPSTQHRQSLSSPPQPPSSSRKRKYGDEPRSPDEASRGASTSSTSSKRRVLPEVIPAPTFDRSARPAPALSPSPDEISRVTSTPSSVASKKYVLPVVSPISTSPTTRPIQTLSPSLAMIVSPVNQTVMASPRSPYVPPPPRHGTSNSPPMPPGGKPMMLQ